MANSVFLDFLTSGNSNSEYLSMCDSLNVIIYDMKYVYGIWDIMDMDFLYYNIYMLIFLVILCST